MHDIRAIRDNPDAFEKAMQRRGLDGVSSQVLAIDEARRAAIARAEQAQAERNAASKQVGQAKASGDDAAFQRLRDLVAAKKDEIAALEAEARAKDEELRNLLMSLPNILANDVPEGADESENVEIRRHGSPRDFAFAPKEHFEIKGVTGGMDFETAAKLSGARFVVLSGAVARIHRALAQFMLDIHTETNGLTETWTPVLVREEMLYGTGQLPKFGADSYRTEDGWWLVPTAEVTLTNIVSDLIVAESYLPRRYVAHTQCFRSEAGSAGRDTAGMLRQHQFEKVEMVSVVTPETSGDEHARMTACAEDILVRLGLPFRTVVLCSGDTGFGATKTHDIEVWLPGQGKYREISSVSNCGAFQARRMNARYRPGGDGRPPARAREGGLRAGGRPRADRGAGERADRGWRRRTAGGARPLSRRPRPPDPGGKAGMRDPQSDSDHLAAVMVATAAVAFAVSPFLTSGFNGFEPDQFPIPQDGAPIQPAGYAFSIWGPIYLWLLANAGYGLFRRADDPDWRAMRWPLTVSLAIGATWIAVAQISAPYATLLIWLMLGAAVVALIRSPRVDRWWAQAPVALYAGWLTAASWVALGLTAAGHGVLLDATGWGYLGLAGALGTALAVLRLRERTPEYAAAVVWALVGVAAANWGSSPGMVGAALAGAALVAAIALREVRAA